MKFNFEAIDTPQRDPLCAWLDGFIACEIIGLIVLVGYCLAHTFQSGL